MCQIGTLFKDAAFCALACEIFVSGVTFFLEIDRVEMLDAGVFCWND